VGEKQPFSSRCHGFQQVVDIGQTQSRWWGYDIDAGAVNIVPILDIAKLYRQAMYLGSLAVTADVGSLFWQTPTGFVMNSHLCHHFSYLLNDSTQRSAPHNSLQVHQSSGNATVAVLVRLLDASWSLLC